MWTKRKLWSQGFLAREVGALVILGALPSAALSPPFSAAPPPAGSAVTHQAFPRGAT